MADFDAERDEILGMVKREKRACRICATPNFTYHVRPLVTLPAADGRSLTLLPLMCDQCGGVTWYELGGATTDPKLSAL